MAHAMHDATILTGMTYIPARDVAQGLWLLAGQRKDEWYCFAGPSQDDMWKHPAVSRYLRQALSMSREAPDYTLFPSGFATTSEPALTSGDTLSSDPLLSLGSPVIFATPPGFDPPDFDLPVDWEPSPLPSSDAMPTSTRQTTGSSSVPPSSPPGRPEGNVHYSTPPTHYTIASDRILRSATKNQQQHMPRPKAVKQTSGTMTHHRVVKQKSKPRKKSHVNKETSDMYSTSLDFCNFKGKDFQSLRSGNFEAQINRLERKMQLKKELREEEGLI